MGNNNKESVENNRADEVQVMQIQENESFELPSELAMLSDEVAIEKRQEVGQIMSNVFNQVSKLKEAVKNVIVTDISDVTSIKLADTLRKRAKDVRLEIERNLDRKRESVQQIKRSYDVEDKMYLKAKQIIQIQLKAIEEDAKYQATFVERYQAEQLEVRHLNRIAELSKFNFENDGFTDIKNMPEDLFQIFIEKQMTLFELAKKAEADRIEAERLAKIEAERVAKEEEERRIEQLRKAEEARKVAEQEAKRIEAERKLQEEKMQKERAEFERKQKEQEAERLRIEAENKRIEAERIESERKAKEALQQAEKLALEKQRQEELRKKSEQIAKEQAEQLRKMQEARLKEQQEALALIEARKNSGDIAKLEYFVQLLSAVEFHPLKDEKLNRAITKANMQITAMIDYFNKIISEAQEQQPNIQDQK